MAWVPIVVNNRRNRYYRSRGAGALVAVVIFFLIFGVFFFMFFNRMNGFVIPIWLILGGFGVFLIILAVIVTSAVSMSQTVKKSKEAPFNSYNYSPQVQTQQKNPYIIQDSNQNQQNKIPYVEIKKEIPVVSDTNYCRYCGAKVERDAVFCHQCGTKL
ncbi:MAG: zinc ribbon domain-containing protein [Promethearchaeota archaeon]|nr:MAG: zinc ribbon domain-containing protein [Candidatus Lokiarchaeota archaeon]